MIRANIETEIAPIVGTEQQAQDLIHFIDQAEAEHGIWETNIFGKTVEQLVDDGITTKVASIGEESQLKLQDTMQRSSTTATVAWFVLLYDSITHPWKVCKTALQAKQTSMRGVNTHEQGRTIVEMRMG